MIHNFFTPIRFPEGPQSLGQWALEKVSHYFWLGGNVGQVASSDGKNIHINLIERRAETLTTVLKVVSYATIVLPLLALAALAVLRCHYDIYVDRIEELRGHPPDSENELSIRDNGSIPEFDPKIESEVNHQVVSLIQTSCALNDEQTELAERCLRVISCTPIKDPDGRLMLQFHKGERQLTFDPVLAATQCLTKEFYRSPHPNFSGIINDVIVLTTNEELLHFIELIQIISPEQGAQLLRHYEALCELKTYLRDDCGLSEDLQDACSLASAAVVYPQAFGDLLPQDDFDNRFIVLSQIPAILSNNNDTQTAARYFPVRHIDLATQYERCLGYPLRYRDGVPYATSGTSKYSPTFPLSIAAGSIRTWCVNDEQPCYWPTFFPLGLHLVRTPDDTRDLEQWKKQFVFDEIMNGGGVCSS